MKNFLLIFAISALAVSCKKESSSADSTQSADQQSIQKTDAAKYNDFQLESFGFPDDIAGCSCYFASDKENFENEKFVYIDDYGKNAYIKLKGQQVIIPVTDGDFNVDNFEKNVDGNGYKIQIKGRKIKEMYEVMMFEGTMTVENSEGKKATTPIYGECGC